MVLGVWQEKEAGDRRSWEDEMQMGFFFDQSRCDGCFTCIVACKDWHDIPAGPASWMRVACVEKGRYPQPFVAFLVMPCYHCARPACAAACPADAITKRGEDGIVVVDKERCLGKGPCQACLEACPYGAPQFALEDGAKMEKCDLCLDRLTEGKRPICVEACPMRALDAGPLEELRRIHGDGQCAEGFSWRDAVGPSVLFKAKVDERGLAIRSVELVPRPTP